MIVAIGGFLAGLTHALMGPDHVAAVTPIALEPHSRPWLAGIRWGTGHSLGVGLVGLLFLALRDVVPVHRISAISERVTGLSLLLIGGWALRKALRLRICTHRHKHDQQTHSHVSLCASNSGRGHKLTTHAALGVGMLHGFAGSSHLIGVLPSLALPTLWDSSQYLAAFGFGTILAMAGLSTAVGSVARRLQASPGSSYRWVLASAACITSGVGVFWIITGGF